MKYFGKKVIGICTWSTTCESLVFTNAELFLEKIKKELNSRDTTGFKFKVVTKSQLVHSQIDKIISSEFGTNSEEH